jgi:hypothetical protein
VRLLREQVLSVQAEILEDIRVAIQEGAARRLDALRLVEFKLKQLNHHLAAGSRILNDLRALRRLLTDEDRETQRQGLREALDRNESECE